MTRQEFMLAALAAAQGGTHTPVQVQKLFFLLDKNLAKHLGGAHFAFSPWDYGPFDRAVYDELERLDSTGMVEISRSSTGRWRTYRLTANGQRSGEKLLESLDRHVAEYIQRSSNWVRSLSFTDLVAAVYRSYPEMKARSVFRG